MSLCHNYKKTNSYSDNITNSKKNKIIRVALLGNPNSGKTSLFNELVGANQKVGNFSGVTIEKYEGKIKHKGYTILFVDLPGTYSLTAYSPEELIARHYIIEEKPDVVIDVVDGTNLERNLYLTTQLMELEANMLVALNMYDEVEKNNINIDVKLLQTLLGSHVIPTSAVKRSGIKELLDHVIRVYTGNITIAKNKLNFPPAIESRIYTIINLLNQDKELETKYNTRWLAIKLLENDKEIYNLVQHYPIWLKIEPFLQDSIKEITSETDIDPELHITEDRHAFISGAIKECVKEPKHQKTSLSEIIDSVLINRVLGLPLFLFIMWLVFQFTFRLGELPMSWVENFFAYVSDILIKIIPTGILQSIIVDGIVAGVGGVLVFLPNILLLFIAISFLEATGYMARAAFVIDKVMHLFGLHGKSFIPMITGFGCSIPAIMATRTLKSKGDRLTTMMIIPFMSCGAKLPVHILLISAFFPARISGNILFAVYCFGLIIGLGTARLLKSTVLKSDSEPFVMELPPYRLPTIKSILIQAKIKAVMYLKRAGTIILAASLVIWLVSNFPQDNNLNKKHVVLTNQINQNLTLTKTEKEQQIQTLENILAAKQLEYSLAGRLGYFIEPLIKPLGFDWRIGIALVTGVAAKEIVVSTLGTIYSIGETTAEDLGKRLQADPNFTTASALSLIVFVLLYIPCISALIVFKKEAGRWKYVAIYSAYAISIAWIFSFAVYNLAEYAGL